MRDPRRFSVRSRVASFGYALRGLWLLVSQEPNARIHSAAALGVLCVGAALRLGVVEWALIAVAITIVLMAEAMNAAVERLGDAVSQEPHPLVGAAKDLAAGSVLLSALGAAAIGALVFIPRLLALF